MSPSVHVKCISVHVPKEACYMRFSGSSVAKSAEIGTTSRGDKMIADFDEEGRIVGIELVGAGKPCQGACRTAREAAIIDHGGTPHGTSVRRFPS